MMTSQQFEDASQFQVLSVIFKKYVYILEIWWIKIFIIRESIEKEDYKMLIQHWGTHVNQLKQKPKEMEHRIVVFW